MQAQRRGERDGAETHIGQPGLAVEIDAQQHVREWRFPIKRAPPHDASDQRGDDKPEMGQRVGEQRVLLEAVAAASAIEQLGNDRRQLDVDRLATNRIEILERNGQRMERVDGAQNIERCFTRAGVTDALKIAFRIEGVRHA